MPARTWKQLADAGPAGGRAIAVMVRRSISKLQESHSRDLEGIYLTLGDTKTSNAPHVIAEATEAFAEPRHQQYRSYLHGKSRWRITPQVFWSLRSLDPDATVRTRLVIPPMKKETYAKCGDVLSFSKLPLDVQAPLWAAVAKETARIIKPGVHVKVWTHGREVPWLHVRIRVTQLKKPS